MIKIGKINKLKVLKTASFGILLDGEDRGDILIPKRNIVEGHQLKKEIEVFIYMDSEDNVTATTLKPAAMVGEFAFLKVVAVSRVGAFMDWGLPKDLFVPFQEQQQKMLNGNSYIVYVYVDKKTDRIAASSKLNKYLDISPAEYSPGEQVNLFIKNRSNLGFNVIINNTHSGLLFFEDVFQPLKTGQKLKGYIKKIREDNRIDVALHPEGYEKVSTLAARILATLRENKGYLEINDKSSPDQIYNTFGMSKKTFKKAIGALYKHKIILVESKGIRLVPEQE